ncbi:hypothetical protein ACWCQZ_36420 [Streptomyces sp. NPDC002285]
MEPVTVVLTALAAGAVAGLKDTVGSAVTDAYQALKGRVTRRVADQPLGEQLLERYESDPAVWEAPLRAALLAAEAEKDPEVLAIARRLLELADSAGVGSGGKYAVAVDGNVQGLVQGDHARVDMRFHEPPQGA